MSAKPDDIPEAEAEEAFETVRLAVCCVDPREAAQAGIDAMRAILTATAERARSEERERAAKLIDAAAEKYHAASVETLSVSQKLRLSDCEAFLLSLSLAIRNGGTE